MKWRFDKEELVERDPEFSGKIDGWIRNALSNRPRSWQCLLRHLPGVFPLEAWAAMERGCISWDGLALEPIGTGTVETEADGFFSVSEHPLDYEWRFSASGVNAVCDVVSQLLAGKWRAEIGCLGCPTVFAAGARRYDQWDWSLLDRRAASFANIPRNGKVRAEDLSQQIAGECHLDLAVVDPPWYNPITKCFLANAVRILKRGAHALLSMPAEGTRSSAADDLAEILDWCSSNGLSLISISKGHLDYKTPFFESNSLLAAGFSATVPCWRRGDLLLFEKTGEIQEFPRFNVSTEKPLVRHEFVIGNSKIVVLNSREDPPSSCKGNSFVPVWKEEIIPSVSSRFTDRGRANIVTSGNRFLYCEQIESVLAHLAGFQRGTKRTSDNAQLMEKLKLLLDTEIIESNKFKMYQYD